MRRTFSSATTTVRTGHGVRLAFVSAVVSLVAGFAASATPIPLYNTYRFANGVTSAGISLTVVAYFAGTIVALLVLGRLSTHLGRRPVAIATLVLLAAGCLVLLHVHGLGELLLGRLLMGLGAGLASSCLTAYIVDTAPDRPPWLAAVVSSQSPVLGLTIGAIGSGALVQYGAWPRTLVYLIMLAALLVCGILLLASEESAVPQPGVWRSLRPRVHLPARTRHLLPVAGAILLATWATGGFFQAFLPSLIVDQLDTRNALIFSLVFSAYMAPSIVGAPLGGQFTPARAQRIGMIIFFVGMVGLVSALAIGTLAIFLIASVIAGAGQGIAVSGSVRSLLSGSSVADRAPIFAAIYLLSYTGAALPSLIAGQLSHYVSLFPITVGYGVLALLATLTTIAAARNPTAG